MTLTIPQTTINISFSFQTNFREGVLVSQSNAWILSLVDGKLQLVCTDSRRCEFGESGMFSDSNWHRLDVIDNGSVVSANASAGHCAIECGRSRTRRDTTPDSMLVVGADAGDSDRAKFVGSIRDFSVNNVKYYPGIVVRYSQN